MEITAASKRAVEFFSNADRQVPDLLSKFPQLEAIHDMVRTELTNAKSIEPVPLFGFSMANFAVAHADHSEAFSPNLGGKNSGRGTSLA